MTGLNKHIDTFYSKILELLKTAHKTVLQSVNTTMFITYFEIGRLIVEEEQKGEEKAKYGQNLINDLSKRLSDEFGKGFSSTNLKQMRSFYLVYMSIRLNNKIKQLYCHSCECRNPFVYI
ncbi:MAG: hypothetical protein HXX16_13245 [Bacteroidales bacterium]|nr:hypothetical protein [Bacteroidales bacterium]